jgi:hypothetical protein
MLVHCRLQKWTIRLKAPPRTVRHLPGSWKHSHNWFSQICHAFCNHLHSPYAYMPWKWKIHVLADSKESEKLRKSAVLWTSYYEVLGLLSDTETWGGKLSWVLLEHGNEEIVWECLCLSTCLCLPFVLQSMVWCTSHDCWNWSKSFELSLSKKFMWFRSGSMWSKHGKHRRHGQIVLSNSAVSCYA